MGNSPSYSNQGGRVIGAMEMNMCHDFPVLGGCCPKWASRDCCGMCPGMSKPSGPEWEAAAPEFEPILEDAFKLATANKGCCGADVHKMKATLDASWTGGANDYLKKHSLSVEVCAFYTSDGKGAHPHLVLQFSKL